MAKSNPGENFIPAEALESEAAKLVAETLKANNRLLKTVGAGLTGLTAAMTPFLRSVDAFQKRSLAMGTNIQSVEKAFGNSVSEMGGFTNRVSANLALLESGLQGYNKSTLDLATRTAATGGSLQAMAKAMRTLQISFRIGSSERERLATHMQTLSEDYRISTDVFAEAVQSISDVLTKDAAVLGIGPQFTEAITELNAIFGAGSTQMVNGFVEALLASDIGGASRAAASNLMDVRSAILRGDGNVTELLLEAITRFGPQFQDMVGSMQQSGAVDAGALDILKTIYGGLGHNSAILSDLLKSGEVSVAQRLEQLDEERKWNDTLTTLKDEVLTPFYESAKHALSIMKTVLANPIVKGLAKVAGFLAPGAIIVTALTTLGVGIVKLVLMVGNINRLMIKQALKSMSGGIAAFGPWALLGSAILGSISIFMSRKEEREQALQEELHRRKMEDEKAYQDLRTDKEKKQQQIFGLYSEGLREHARDIIFGPAVDRGAKEQRAEVINVMERVAASVEWLDPGKGESSLPSESEVKFKN